LTGRWSYSYATVKDGFYFAINFDEEGYLSDGDHMVNTFHATILAGGTFKHSATDTDGKKKYTMTFKEQRLGDWKKLC